MLRGVIMLAVLGLWASAQAPIPAPEQPSTVRKPEPKSEARDPGRPVLKRGGPAQERRADDAPAARPQENPAYKVIEADEEGRAETVVHSKPLSPEEELLERARAFAAAYIESLPNFVVEQFVYRYRGEGLRPKWKKQDELQAEVMYLDRKENYGDIRLNGRKLKSGNPADTGVWSTGEFGSVLFMLMAANPPPRFKSTGKTEDVSGIVAKIYEFSATHEPGNWKIRIGSSARPPFHGRIWIDKDSARVYRLEMHTRQLPAGYTVDKVELSIDYDWVSIAGDRHFLPVRSDNLSCYRDTVTCTRNETFFRNYRRFGAESQILQVESEITFDGDAPPKSKTTPPSLEPKKPG